MNIRRFLPLMIALVLFVMTTAGCGGATEDESGGAYVPERKELILTTDEIVIRMWDHASENPSMSILEDAVARFEEAYPNIHIEETHIQNEIYKQRLLIAMASGRCPDMYMHWGGGPLTEYAQLGLAEDLTDLYEQYNRVPFLDSALQQSSVDGRIHAVPYGGIQGSGFFYNKEIFKELGLEVPEYIDELEEICEVLKENGITPFALANAPGWTGSMYYMYLVARNKGTQAFDDVFFGENGGSFTSEGFWLAGRKIQEWVDAGYFPMGVNALSADNGQDRVMMYRGEAAMMLQGSWMCSTLPAESREWYKNTCGFFPFPKDRQAESEGVDQNVTVGTSVGNAFSFHCRDANGVLDEEKLEACFMLTTRFINDDIYNQRQLENGRLPAIEGMSEFVSDPILLQVWDQFANASAVQLWYDQALPPAVIEVHKRMMNELFGMIRTPYEIGVEQDKALADYRDND